MVTEPALCVIKLPPYPPLQAALPPALCMAALPSPIWKITLVWLIYLTYFKNRMVEESSHVKQESLTHVCKIGLIVHCYFSCIQPAILGKYIELCPVTQ
jgi:hypothetical protein